MWLSLHLELDEGAGLEYRIILELGLILELGAQASLTDKLQLRKHSKVNITSGADLSHLTEENRAIRGEIMSRLWFEHTPEEVD